MTTIQLSKGERRDVPEWTWVELARPARNGNIYYKIGDSVGLHEGAQVEVVGVDQDFDVLVRYHHPRTERAPFGTSCPDGALFFLPSRVVSGWPAPGAVLAERMDEDTRREEAVRRLLGETP